MRRWSAVAALALMLATCPALAAVRKDLDQELWSLKQGKVPARHIPGARFRVAVFTYEDPDGTGLGNALAALVSSEMLLHCQVSSFGVMQYEGGLMPERHSPLGYFDKVEKVTEAQEVTLSVWGSVRHEAGKLLIDTYVQIPPSVVKSAFRWSVRLPEQMGGGELVAHLHPTRILAQSLVLPEGSGEALRQAARAVETLRDEPRADAPIVATLPVDAVYRVLERSGEWVKVAVEGDQGPGWLPSESHCKDDCQRLLDAARFAGSILRYMESKDTGKTREAPKVTDALAEDPAVIRDQILMLDALNEPYVKQIKALTLKPAEARIEKNPGPTDRAIPSAGAVFENIRGMASVAIGLQVKFREIRRERPGDEAQIAYQAIALDKGKVREVAFGLADASLADPRNTDILHNLAVLFDYAGDTARAKLAGDLEAANP